MRILIPCLFVLLALPAPAGAQWRISESPVTTIGSANGSGADAFGSIESVLRLDDGTIVVADALSRDIRFFSGEGRFLARSGRAGDGPGEFRTIGSMWRCRDLIHVYDPAASRITVLDGRGTNVDLIGIADHLGVVSPPFEFYCGPTGVIAYLNRPTSRPMALGPHRPNVNLTIRDESGATATLSQVPVTERYFTGTADIPRPMGKPTSVAVGTDVVHVATGTGTEGGTVFEVLRYAFDGRRLDGIRDTLATVTVTALDVRRFIDAAVEAASPAATNARQAYESLTYPETFPTVVNLLLDPRGDLWVEEFRRPGDRASRWRIYDTNGARIGMIMMPENFVAMEIGDDFVAGVVTDELGVEYARIYTLSRP